METGKRWRCCLKLMNEKGASAVEFALVLPLFIAMFFGIIEYGWVMTQKIVLSHAVSEGARAAIKMPDGTSDDDLAAVARQKTVSAFSVVGTLAEGDITVEIRPAEDIIYQPVPKRISVDVPSWTYTPIVGYLPASVLPSTLKANAIFAFP